MKSNYIDFLGEEFLQLSDLVSLKASFSISVAYNDDIGMFMVVNNTMKEWYDYHGLINDMSRIPYEFEVLKPFFQNNNISVNWINCNWTWGWYDDETGTWTGAVGKVKVNTYPTL